MKNAITPRQKLILEAMQQGCRVWRYSSGSVGWVLGSAKIGEVRGATLIKMTFAELIEEDLEKSYYREGSGSDIIYKITEKGIASLNQKGSHVKEETNPAQKAPDHQVHSQ